MKKVQTQRFTATIRRTSIAVVLSVVLIALGPGVVRVQAQSLVGYAPCELPAAAELAWYGAFTGSAGNAVCASPIAGNSLASATADPATVGVARSLERATVVAKRSLAQLPAGTATAGREGDSQLIPRAFGPLRDKAPCSAGSLNVVAHEDDDLLFMNPDVSGDIAAGRCVRTVYLTAGDAGMDAAYWQGREAGAKAAYAAMAGIQDAWLDGREQLDGRFIAVSYLRDKPNISLMFLRLPDGNLHGAGFAGSGNQSLAQLLDGSIPNIQSVYDQSPYTAEQLVRIISQLVTLDQPNDVRALNADNPEDGDHSDHHAAGQLVRMATAAPAVPLNVTHYIGYPIAAMPSNLADSITARKQQIFLQYAQTDGAVCQTLEACLLTTSYGMYLGRHYTVQPPDLAAATAP